MQLSRLVSVKLIKCLLNCVCRRDLLDTMVPSSIMFAKKPIKVIIAKVELLHTISLREEVVVVMATVLLELKLLLDGAAAISTKRFKHSLNNIYTK